MLILLIIIVVVVSLSNLLFNGAEGSVSIPSILGIGIYWAYIVKSLRLNSNENKEYKIPNINRKYFSGKDLSIISYHLMKADGKIDDKEKIYFENFMLFEFEKRYMVNYYIKNFYIFPEQTNSLKNSCIRLTKSINNLAKIQLLHYYISLVTRDKFLSVGEISLLRKICKYSHINYRTLDAVLAMFNYTSEEDINKRKYAKKYTSNSIEKYYKIL
jgi:uncharacterized tellurite resistance protein B-like protein